jgi:hypothetical protein
MACPLCSAFVRPAASRSAVPSRNEHFRRIDHSHQSELTEGGVGGVRACTEGASAGAASGVAGFSANRRSTRVPCGLSQVDPVSADAVSAIRIGAIEPLVPRPVVSRLPLTAESDPRSRSSVIVIACRIAVVVGFERQPVRGKPEPADFKRWPAARALGHQPGSRWSIGWNRSSEVSFSVECKTARLGQARFASSYGKALCQGRLTLQSIVPCHR